jgi:hypothetical protein
MKRLVTDIVDPILFALNVHNARNYALDRAKGRDRKARASE